MFQIKFAQAMHSQAEINHGPLNDALSQFEGELTPEAQVISFNRYVANFVCEILLYTANVSLFQIIKNLVASVTTDPTTTVYIKPLIELLNQPTFRIPNEWIPLQREINQVILECIRKIALFDGINFAMSSTSE